MCGRFTLIRLEDLNLCFPWINPPPEQARPRYNIAPTQPLLIATNQPVHGKFKFDHALWGLIPSWAKDPAIGNRMINARAETLAQKPAFRNAFRRRRCLIPADGFYEWRKEADGSKTPMYIRTKAGKPFAFAGLWEDWQDPAGGASEVRSCTIITTDPNDLMRTIHDRMPVILPPAAQHQWLSDVQDTAALQQLLVPFEGEMTATPVSRAVNNPRNDTPECVKPA